MTKGIIKTTIIYNTADGFNLKNWQSIVTHLVSKGAHIEEATITNITSINNDEYGRITAIVTCENLNLPLWDNIIKKFINKGFTILETKFYEIH